MTPCQISEQHVHKFVTFYEQIWGNDAVHRVYEKCLADNYIQNDRHQSHSFTNKDLYQNGKIYHKCSLCGYMKYMYDLPDFEWDVPKGADSSDIYIEHGEWNRYVDILSLKLSTANRNSNLEHLKVTEKELISASKFNGIIDGLILLKAKNVPSKVDGQTIVLPTSHLNCIRDNLNAIRNP